MQGMSTLNFLCSDARFPRLWYPLVLYVNGFRMQEGSVMHKNGERLNGALLRLLYLFREQRTDWDACNILITKIMPLLEQHPLSVQWAEARRSDRQQRDDLEAQIPEELKQAFADIKSRIRGRALAREQSVRQRLCMLDSMLTFRLVERQKTRIRLRRGEPMCSLCGAALWAHQVWVLPSYAYGVHTVLKSLCHAIVKLGGSDLLTKYVKVHDAKEYVAPQRYRCIYCKHVHDCSEYGIALDDLSPEWSCPTCGGSKDNFLPLDVGGRVIQSIERFTLARSMMNELVLLGSQIPLWDHDDPDAQVRAAYETLCAIKVAWEMDGDFLRRKYLWYYAAQECKESGRLLEFHSLSAAIAAIKNKAQGKNRALYYTRAAIKEALDCLAQRLGIVVSGEDAYPAVWPLSVELIQEEHGVKLRLQIEWVPGVYETCHLHTFQEADNTSNSLYDFTKDLWAEEGRWVAVDPAFVTGANIKKYLHRIGIRGALEQLFVEYRDAHSVRLRSSCIDLSGQSEIVRRKLCRQVDKLKTVGWVISELPLSGHFSDML